MTEDLLLQRARADGDAPAPELFAAVTMAATSGRFVRMSAEERWAVFAAALGAPRPSVAFEALRRQRALAVLLSTCADIAEAHKDDDEREPTSADRGLA